jgi:hypothetical protein
VKEGRLHLEVYSFTTENIVKVLQRGRDAILSTMTLAGIATPIASLSL